MLESALNGIGHAEKLSQIFDQEMHENVGNVDEYSDGQLYDDDDGVVENDDDDDDVRDKDYNPNDSTEYDND